MKKALTTQFQTRLWDAVKAIEQVSQVEVVVIMRAHSEHYRDIALLWGMVGALLSHTYMMFAPDEFNDELIYGVPVIAFFVCYLLSHIRVLTRLSVTKARLKKNVEIMARALFQKGGIYHTKAKIGVLIYGSWLEKSVYILPDRGAEMALPLEEWQKLRSDFQRIFTEKHPHEALLAQLGKLPPLFALYLPKMADDINELADDMEIEL